MDGSFKFDEENNLLAGELKVGKLVSDLLETDESKLELTKLDDDGKQHLLIPNESFIRTPVFVYSKQRLVHNFTNYKQSFQKCLTEKYNIKTNISYSMKANFNPSILKLFLQMNSWSSLVNENELRLALKVGFPGHHLIFNGNGKTLSEIELAVKAGAYLNIDSVFNLKHTIEVCKKLNEDCCLPAKLIIRVNQSVSVQVHKYLDTSYKNSKFGVAESQLNALIDLIKQNNSLVSLVGFHIHLGSTIKSIDVYEKSIESIVNLYKEVKEKHKMDSLSLINFGGGLGIDYERFSKRTAKTSADSNTSSIHDAKLPTPTDLANAIGEHVKDLKGLTVVVEPGRSLIADSAVLLTKLIGYKENDYKKFLVVDGSMCEVIRPCLYSAYHHIDHIEASKTSSNKDLVDVVGPVCESGDFLGKDRYLELPVSNNQSEFYLAVMDVGAYCAAMASNYNLHSKPAEILIDNTNPNGDVKYILTKKSEKLEDILASFL